MPNDPTNSRTSAVNYGEWFQSWNPEPEYLRGQGGMAHVPRPRPLDDGVDEAEIVEPDDTER